MSSKPKAGAQDQSLEEMREAVKRLSKEARSKAATSAEAEHAPTRTEEAREGAPAQTDAEPALRIETPDPDDKMADAMRRAEAVLFASDRPIDAETLAKALPPGIEPGDVLMKLSAEFKARGVQLVELGGKWRFQTAPDLAFLFEETREQPRQLSRAAKETLAIIAYCQPTTRAEIEDVRGVAVSKGTIDVLMDAGWVRPRGRRRTPGRPITYGTTDNFMVAFGLDSLDSLPGREELRASGLLSSSIPRDFEFAGTPRDPDTGEILAEDPVDDAEFQTDFFEGQTDRD